MFDWDDERHPGGTRLTAYGQQLLPHAQRVEQEIAALEQFIRSSARALNGVIRLTCPEPVVARITRSPLLERLQARHPGLRVEFVMSDHYIDLRKGEADVALRSGDTVDNQLIGRKVADSLWAVYGGRDYLARHGSPARLEDLAQHAWVGFDESMTNHRATRWLRQVAPDARIVGTSSSVLGMVHSAKANMGLAALPTALGDAEPDLVRVLGPVPELKRIWRLLTTRQLRRTPRVSAFFEFMASEVATLRPILTVRLVLVRVGVIGAVLRQLARAPTARARPADRLENRRRPAGNYPQGARDDNSFRRDDPRRADHDSPRYRPAGCPGDG